MRGKASASTAIPGSLRITPAYAGKRLREGIKNKRKRDHPRVCGEKFSSMWRRYMVSGSPPRMRGKAARPVRNAGFPGITPAYAGKRLREGIKNKRKRDHPRVCGEKTLIRLVLFAVRGSPPRMRGKEDLMYRKDVMLRITPAYAGKSVCVCVCVCVDHPRVCGEKTKKIPSHRPFQLHPVPVSFSFA